MNKLKNLKFVIIGPYTENTKDLEKEIKKQKHKASVFQLKDVFFNYKKGKFQIRWNEKDLNSFDIFILRAYNKNLIEAQILAEKLTRSGKVVIDEIVGNKFIPSKIFEASRFAGYGLNHPETYQAMHYSSWKEIVKQIKMPVIIKPLYGQKGKGMKLLTNKKEVLKFFKKNPKGFLAQEYLPIDSDIRVFIVGGKVLGGIKRNIIKNDFRSNISLGSSAEKVILKKEMKSIALKAVKVMKYEVAGVDLIMHENKTYVLEVNATPQWQGLKSVIDADPAEYIINYALKKYEKNKNRFL